MLHGKKERFAIEWELDCNPEGSCLLGNVCYWIRGNMVGNYQRGAALSDMLVALKYAIGDCGSRYSKRFCLMSSAEVYETLHAALFESAPALTETCNDEAWARFDVTVSLRVFEDWRLYLVDCEDRSRLIAGAWSAESGMFTFHSETQLDRGEFDQVIREFVVALGLAETALSSSGSGN